jgi:hypothetical protein
MAAPTNTADVKKTLANSEPSTHGPSRPISYKNLTSAFGATRNWAARRLAIRASKYRQAQSPGHLAGLGRAWHCNKSEAVRPHSRRN